MRSHFRREIQFIRHRRVFFAISIVLVVASLLGVVVRGVNLGIEFQGGTQVSFNATGDVTIAQMRDAFSSAGESDAVVQTTQTGDEAGFLVRTTETDPSSANALASAVATSLGLEDSSYQVTTIGPNWGSDVTRSSVLAFVVAIALIIAFVSVRYEFKMSLMAIVSLLQVMVIVVGLYAWFQIEVTPNVVAALLTITGYCLYDTVVVFNRVNENVRDLHDGVHRTILQITNFSENQVIIRSINTALSSLVPVAAMLFFGGETLKGFAFAMFVGLALGAYSSITIAAPLYALWKGRESHWREMEARFGEGASGQGASAPTVVEAPDRTDDAKPEVPSGDSAQTRAPQKKAKPRNKNSGKVR